MENKKGGNTLIIILLLLILGVVGFYVINNANMTGNVIGAVAKPSLLVTVTGGGAGFSLSQGCKTTLKGTVENYGKANAEGVIVSCKLKGTKGTTTGTQSIGSIYKAGSSPFTITIDNDCPKPDDADCKATCRNC